VVAFAASQSGVADSLAEAVATPVHHARDQHQIARYVPSKGSLIGLGRADPRCKQKGAVAGNQSIIWDGRRHLPLSRVIALPAARQSLLILGDLAWRDGVCRATELQQQHS
jgi:hypothetical protein